MLVIKLGTKIAAPVELFFRFSGSFGIGINNLYSLGGGNILMIRPSSSTFSKLTTYLSQPYQNRRCLREPLTNKYFEDFTGLVCFFRRHDLYYLPLELDFVMDEEFFIYDSNWPLVTKSSTVSSKLLPSKKFLTSYYVEQRLASFNRHRLS